MTAREAELWISQTAGVGIDDTAVRDKIMNMIERTIREAVEAEREACANVCAGGSHDPDDWGAYYADEIRARSKVMP